MNTQFSKYFKTEKDVYVFLKKEAPKFKSFNQARDNDARFGGVKALLNQKKIKADDVFKYFGGRRSSRGTTDVSRYFKTTTDALSYLKSVSSKYSSLGEAREEDIRVKSIYHLMVEGKLSKDLLFSYFGGRQRAEKMTRLEWFQYLDLNWEKYASFSQFIAHDEKGATLDSVIYKRSSDITKEDIYKRYWKKSAKAELREIKAMNRFAKNLKKLNFVLTVEQEVVLDENSRVDIKLTLKNGRIILIEGKHDLSQWSKNHTTEQIKRYALLGKKLFANKYQKTILCSPKGRYGLSFSETVKVLKVLNEIG